AIEQTLCLACHRPVVEEESPCSRHLPADEDVLDRVQMAEGDRLLVNNRNPRRLGGADAAAGQGAIIDEDPSFRGGDDAGEDFDQRALARPVFAAQPMDLAPMEDEGDL